MYSDRRGPNIVVQSKEVLTWSAKQRYRAWAQADLARGFQDQGGLVHVSVDLGFVQIQWHLAPALCECNAVAIHCLSYAFETRMPVTGSDTH